MLKEYFIGVDAETLYIVSYTSASDASLNSDEWATVWAYSLDEAFANYEEAFEKWKNNK